MNFIDVYLPKESSRRWIASGLYRNPILFPVAFVRSLCANWKLFGIIMPIKIRLGIGQRIKIKVHKTATITAKKIIKVVSWGGTNTASSIHADEKSVLDFDGEFEIGPNVHISLSRNSSLRLGGKRNSSGSGITSDARIMVANNISIGADTIISWGTYISDSDWHYIEGTERIKPVCIGSNVWVSHDVSILKGSVVPDGCIVGAKSLVSKAFDENCAVIAGVPARIVKRNVRWAR